MVKGQSDDRLLLLDIPMYSNVPDGGGVNIMNQEIGQKSSQLPRVCHHL